MQSSYCCFCCLCPSCRHSNVTLLTWRTVVMHLPHVLRLKIIVAVTCVIGLAFSSAASAAVNSQFASNSPVQTAPKNSLDYNVYKNWCEADHTQSDNWQVQLGYCLGYLQGLYWGQVIGSPVSQKPFCLPSNLQKSDMVEALSMYARNHPTHLTAVNMSASETARLVASAFKEHFSCD